MAMVGEPAPFGQRPDKRASLRVVEAIAQVVPGVALIEIVIAPGAELSEFDLPSWSVAGSDVAASRIRERVQEQLAGDAILPSFTLSVEGTTWAALVTPMYAHEAIEGALVIARQGRDWSSRERAVIESFQKVVALLLSDADTERQLLHRRRLDELVWKVANKLMPVSATTRREALAWTVRELAEFLSSDVAFLRRNDHQRGLSVLDVEWPIRENVPDPDPLGEVPFDSDPIFGALRNLREPFAPRSSQMPDDYLERVEQATGITELGGAGVPLIRDDVTVGVLGFLHFGWTHAWTPDEIGTLQAIASLLVQMEARVDAEEQTRYFAVHDELTGLPNRRAVSTWLQERHDSGKSASVLFLDLDRFKTTNDFLGYASGDQVLVVVADRIRTSVRPGDLAARLGGDEFIVLLSESASEMEAFAVAERVQKVVSAPIDLGGHEITNSTSIGIVNTTGPMHANEVLAWAGVALHAAKAAGRNQVVVLDEEMRAVSDERAQTELMLRRAVAGIDLELHFQPEVDMRSGGLLAAEALIRWRHPVRGLLSASEFIGVAEDSGLIVDFGRWVIDEACRQMAVWNREYPALRLMIRVNMSPLQFLSRGIVPFVSECLSTHQISGGQLCIEVTERAVQLDDEMTSAALNGLKEFGVQVAMDDFGTGVSALTYLKSLPLDILKVDKSFVAGVTTDRADRAIVDAIIRLGDALGLEVVAEGVEAIETVEALLALGCHRGQGYLISHALPPAELAGILRAGGVDPLSLGRIDAGRRAERVHASRPFMQN
jgi:diguanylate cyclase (GGDEF)-like protein